MKEIVVATTNKGKIAEIELALAKLPVKIVALSDFKGIPEAVETGDSFVANAKLKAEHYAFYTKKACLADDSGLEVDALDGAPGIYSARYAGEDADDAMNNQKLLAELAGVPSNKRSARFRCVLAFADTDGMIITVDGSKEGVIGQEMRGAEGFGYDPLFFMPEMGKTMAECSKTEKNKISHRGEALKGMASRLEEYLK
ncbi:XTP/dITP diphosphatase [Pelosinus sp. IPA-1]|uniref:XTP/dITP diphosphatase n=1 Tax=Pelosinus sp. IPA-1 TaxID=3029569 RepID=UPI00243619EA|nr:XTP/dITP diphosphatase [Pelosinus sp. IPA-1]GMA98508.1 non-canonical purine NTP pyrophosphatase [Pelosinus sp. IPA-1]